MMRHFTRLLKQAIFPILLISASSAKAESQADTLRYTPQQAERIFLSNNVPLLAEKLNIQQADARILQAKAWPNPSFSLGEVQLYRNATTDESPALFGNFWRNRTFSAQLEQLVQTAGKRKKNIILETKNKELATTLFTDMLQALKVEFRQAIAELIYLQRVQGDLLFQYAEVNTLLQAQQAQFREGNISQAELYRIKALMVSLQSNVNDLNEQMTEQQRTLKTLMAIDVMNDLVIEDPSDKVIPIDLRAQSLEALIALAVKQNASLQAVRNETGLREAQLALEKANRVPDVAFNLNYDRNGNNQLNFLGAGITTDLPFFNRNKGNIRAAQIAVQQSGLMERNKTLEIGNTVVKTWQDLNRAITLYEGMDDDYIEQLGVMTRGIVENFRRRNMSLLEFLDFFESFRDSKEKYFESIKNIYLKKEDLNYLTGSDF